MDVELTQLERSFVARGLAVAACGAFVARMFHEISASLFWLAYLCIFAVLATFAAGLGAYRARATFRAKVDGEGIWREGVLLVDRAALVSGGLAPRPLWMTAKLLVLKARPGTPSYRFRVEDDAAGKACLAELRLDPDHIRVTHVLPFIPCGRVDGSTFILLGAAWSVLFVPMVALMFDGPKPGNDAAMMTAMVVGLALHVAFWTWLRLRSPVRLEIGHEGLAVTSGVFHRRTRVVPYDDVTDVRAWRMPSGPTGSVPQGIDVVLREDEAGRRGELRLHTRMSTNQGAVDEVATAIEKAWRRHRQRRTEGAAAPELHLEREGRPLETWAADLERAGRGGSGYRDIASDPESLLTVLDDQTATAEQRTAAAFALTAAPKSDLHQRVRIAAETVAAPDLRATLEALAGTEEEERVEALRRVQR